MHQGVFFCMQVTRPGTTFEIEFFVVEDNVSVTLSGSVAEKLGLVHRVASLEQDTYDVVKPYEDVSTGLDRHSCVIYHLKLKPGSRGVVKSARRIPCAATDRANAKLDRMEAAGVIVEVTEPTLQSGPATWISSYRTTRFAHSNGANWTERFDSHSFKQV
ncbi:uncharacterized protein LOC142776543 [Rhipicephalus microplus]|uniref:uncharacterized protein LOC142776543 n=1 Tax=Rhipicephalus microplus TaxID=6941 RepID=UPI003F6B38E7